ncbi:dual serine/threonine and tyrosine protein kinase [Kryptolebias marmoratus]|uniref:Dual serine/threonine and tyrosine protein kinase n=1 Tax=Kryptolebias marmoratus TaxID=37003 RepID=A0A3Q3BHQ6_KRYMA|nr:dual serine/threonine and tyrosine protein kinase [Kryptolebias marmoratus]XP_024861586.1 dual serine/threonine and tyrosine protein kinase [Kryptolebias marmoratus]
MMEGNVQQQRTPLTPLARELTRVFSNYNKHSVQLKKNLKETKLFFREISQNYSNATASTISSDSASLETVQLSCISFPSHEEEFLRNTVGAAPYILVLGQDCAARYQLLNCLLGERLLPLGPAAGEACQGAQGLICKRRKLYFTYGRQTGLSLALPGQYELVHQLAANRGRWDTVPREDLEIHEECEDPAHRLAELEITLHHPMLQEAKVRVVPCSSVQPIEEALEDCAHNVIPVVLYAINQDSLTSEQVAELRKVKEMLSFPICFIRVPDATPVASPEPGRRAEKDREKSSLHKQLLSLGFLNNHMGSCSCGAPTQAPTPGAKPQSMLGESFERLHRLLVPFARQVLQNQQVEAANLLNGLHCRCLDLFINQAFDMQRDLQITPRRLEYTREKEGDLFNSLMAIANRKQEEMKEMIVETLSSMKEQLLEDAANLEFKDIIVTTNGEPVTSKEIKSCIHLIQELIVVRLNQAVANKLISSVDYLRESFVGTLERCLSSLEKSNMDSSVHITSNHLKQLLNAAYHVEVTFHSGSSVTRFVWEQIKQIIHRITFVNPPAITPEWKRKVAQDAIESLSAAKLARSICSQFRTRLNSSHEAFALSLRQLEEGHTGRLERTEDLWLRVRKDHAPRLARLSLESRSLRDVLLHGKPKLGKELGRGQYGVVYLCDSWGGHYPCALKSVVPPDDKHWNDLALEFHYTRSLPRHERLVDLHGSVIDHTYGDGSSIAVLLIMERLHRDLYTGLKAGLTLKERLQIALDVVEGIRFLHSQGLVHRDIKLKNVLLDKQNRAKITDLGFCKPEAMMSGSIVGTPIHMAPELFTGKYDNSVDVYAFGILFWYLCTGSVKLPEAFEKCSSKDQLWNNVKKGSRPERQPTFDEDCWQLMEACWNGDPSLRPLLGIVQPILQSIMERLCGRGSEERSGGLEDSN